MNACEIQCHPALEVLTPRQRQFVVYRVLNPLAPTSRRRLRQTCERAGITVVTWHDLRHTFASHLVAKSAPLPAVQKLLGHSEVKMTMRYSHLGPDQLRGAISLLGPVST